VDLECKAESGAGIVSHVEFDEFEKEEIIDYETSMITDKDPLRGLLFFQDLGVSHTLHVRIIFPFFRFRGIGLRTMRLFGVVVV